MPFAKNIYITTVCRSHIKWRLKQKAVDDYAGTMQLILLFYMDRQLQNSKFIHLHTIFCPGRQLCSFNHFIYWNWRLVRNSICEEISREQNKNPFHMNVLWKWWALLFEVRLSLDKSWFVIMNCSAWNRTAHKQLPPRHEDCCNFIIMIVISLDDSNVSSTISGCWTKNEAFFVQFSLGIREAPAAIVSIITTMWRNPTYAVALTLCVHNTWIIK